MNGVRQNNRIRTAINTRPESPSWLSGRLARSARTTSRYRDPHRSPQGEPLTRNLAPHAKLRVLLASVCERSNMATFKQARVFLYRSHPTPPKTSQSFRRHLRAQRAIPLLLSPHAFSSIEASSLSPRGFARRVRLPMLMGALRFRFERAMNLAGRRPDPPLPLAAFALRGG